MSVAKWSFAAAAIASLGANHAARAGWLMKLIAGIDFLAAALVLLGLTENRWLVLAGLPLAAGMIANAATLKFLGADFAGRSHIAKS